MKTSKQTTRLTIIARLETIEAKLPRLYRDYEGNARCSKKHLAAYTAIHNLESERSMLEAALEGMLSKAH